MKANLLDLLRKREQLENKILGITEEYDKVKESELFALFKELRELKMLISELNKPIMPVILELADLRFYLSLSRRPNVIIDNKADIENKILALQKQLDLFNYTTEVK